MQEPARDRSDLNRLVQAYFAERHAFERLAAIAAAERLVGTAWRTELLARRRAANEAEAAAQASLTTMRNAADRRDELADPVDAELSRLQRVRRDRLSQLLGQLRRVSTAKDRLLTTASPGVDADAARLRTIAQRAIVARHYPRGSADHHLVDEPVVAAGTCEDNDDVLVHVDSDENAHIAASALADVGVRVVRDHTYDPSGNNGVRLIVKT